LLVSSNELSNSRVGPSFSPLNSLSKYSLHLSYESGCFFTVGSPDLNTPSSFTRAWDRLCWDDLRKSSSQHRRSFMVRTRTGYLSTTSDKLQRTYAAKARPYLGNKYKYQTAERKKLDWVSRIVQT
jgi:hypothetical protein